MREGSYPRPSKGMLQIIRKLQAHFLFVRLWSVFCDLFFTVILVVNDRFTVGMVSQRSCDEAAYQTGINPGGMVFLADVPAENDFIIGFTLFHPTEYKVLSGWVCV